MHRDAAILRSAFEISVARLQEQLIEIEPLAYRQGISALQTREFQDLADHGVEPFDLALHAIQLPREIRRRLAREPKRHAHSGERGA